MELKIIAITQRVEYIQEYGEKRDALDQAWIEFLRECNYIPLILPNNLEVAKLLIQKFNNISGIILTGGNSILSCDGDATERDELERFLIKYAISNEIPIIGICRGMQMLQNYFGIELKRIDEHVCKHHSIMLDGEMFISNSYHNFGAKYSNENLKVLAENSDGIIEVVQNKKMKIWGMMHHPEREKPFREVDIKIIKRVIEEEDV